MVSNEHDKECECLNFCPTIIVGTVSTNCDYVLTCPTEKAQYFPDQPVKENPEVPKHYKTNRRKW